MARLSPLAKLDRRLADLAQQRAFAWSHRDIRRGAELGVLIDRLSRERARLAVRPIIMSGRNVRAIFDGLKTQTRRLVKLPEFGPSSRPAFAWTFLRCGSLIDVDNVQLREQHCPYGREGDRLYVRETWFPDPPRNGTWPDMELFGDPDNPGSLEVIPHLYRRPEHCLYRATWTGGELARWRSSIFMPRWASRILLELVEIRVERLQDITEADARAEGLAAGVDFARFPGDLLKTARDAYAVLWNALNGKRAPWASNPWVWVLTFRRLEEMPWLI